MVSEWFDVKEIEIEIKKGNEEGKSQKDGRMEWMPSEYGISRYRNVSHG